MADNLKQWADSDEEGDDILGSMVSDSAQVKSGLLQISPPPVPAASALAAFADSDTDDEAWPAAAKIEAAPAPAPAAAGSLSKWADSDSEDSDTLPALKPASAPQGGVVQWPGAGKPQVAARPPRVHTTALSMEVNLAFLDSDSDEGGAAKPPPSPESKQTRSLAQWRDSDDEDDTVQLTGSGAGGGPSPGAAAPAAVGGEASDSESSEDWDEDWDEELRHEQLDAAAVAAAMGDSEWGAPAKPGGGGVAGIRSMFKDMAAASAAPAAASTRSTAASRLGSLPRDSWLTGQVQAALFEGGSGASSSTKAQSVAEQVQAGGATLLWQRLPGGPQCYVGGPPEGLPGAATGPLPGALEAAACADAAFLQTALPTSMPVPPSLFPAADAGGCASAFGMATPLDLTQGLARSLGLPGETPPSMVATAQMVVESCPLPHLHRGMLHCATAVRAAPPPAECWTPPQHHTLGTRRGARLPPLPSLVSGSQPAALVRDTVQQVLEGVLRGPAPSPTAGSHRTLSGDLAAGQEGAEAHWRSTALPEALSSPSVYVEAFSPGEGGFPARGVARVQAALDDAAPLSATVQRLVHPCIGAPFPEEDVAKLQAHIAGAVEAGLACLHSELGGAEAGGSAVAPLSPLWLVAHTTIVKRLVHVASDEGNSPTGVVCAAAAAVAVAAVLFQQLNACVGQAPTASLADDRWLPAVFEAGVDCLISLTPLATLPVPVVTLLAGRHYIATEAARHATVQAAVPAPRPPVRRSMSQRDVRAVQSPDRAAAFLRHVEGVSLDLGLLCKHGPQATAADGAMAALAASVRRVTTCAAHDLFMLCSQRWPGETPEEELSRRCQLQLRLVTWQVTAGVHIATHAIASLPPKRLPQRRAEHRPPAFPCPASLRRATSGLAAAGWALHATLQLEMASPLALEPELMHGLGIVSAVLAASAVLVEAGSSPLAIAGAGGDLPMPLLRGDEDGLVPALGKLFVAEQGDAAAPGLPPRLDRVCGLVPVWHFEPPAASCAAAAAAVLSSTLLCHPRSAMRDAVQQCVGGSEPQQLTGALQLQHAVSAPVLGNVIVAALLPHVALASTPGTGPAVPPLPATQLSAAVGLGADSIPRLSDLHPLRFSGEVDYDILAQSGGSGDEAVAAPRTALGVMRHARSVSTTLAIHAAVVVDHSAWWTQAAGVMTHALAHACARVLAWHEQASARNVNMKEQLHVPPGPGRRLRYSPAFHLSRIAQRQATMGQGLAAVQGGGVGDASLLEAQCALLRRCAGLHRMLTHCTPDGAPDMRGGCVAAVHSLSLDALRLLGAAPVSGLMAVLAAAEPSHPDGGSAFLVLPGAAGKDALPHNLLQQLESVALWGESLCQHGSKGLRGVGVLLTELGMASGAALKLHQVQPGFATRHDVLMRSQPWEVLATRSSAAGLHGRAAVTLHGLWLHALTRRDLQAMHRLTRPLAAAWRQVGAESMALQVYSDTLLCLHGNSLLPSPVGVVPTLAAWVVDGSRVAWPMFIGSAPSQPVHGSQWHALLPGTTAALTEALAQAWHSTVMQNVQLPESPTSSGGAAPPPNLPSMLEATMDYVRQAVPGGLVGPDDAFPRHVAGFGRGTVNPTSSRQSQTQQRSVDGWAAYAGNAIGRVVEMRGVACSAVNWSPLSALRSTSKGPVLGPQRAWSSSTLAQCLHFTSLAWGAANVRAQVEATLAAEAWRPSEGELAHLVLSLAHCATTLCMHRLACQVTTAAILSCRPEHVRAGSIPPVREFGRMFMHALHIGRLAIPPPMKELHRENPPEVHGSAWLALLLQLAVSYFRAGQHNDSCTVLLHVLPFLPLLAAREEVDQELTQGAQLDHAVITHVTVCPSISVAGGRAESPLQRSHLVIRKLSTPPQPSPLHVVPLGLQANLLWVRNLTALGRFPAAAASAAFLVHTLERFVDWEFGSDTHRRQSSGVRSPPRTTTGAAAAARAKAVAEVHLERGRALGRWVQNPAAAMDVVGRDEKSTATFKELPGQLQGVERKAFHAWNTTLHWQHSSQVETTPHHRSKSSHFDVGSLSGVEARELHPWFNGSHFASLWGVLEGALASLNTAALIFTSFKQFDRALRCRMEASSVTMEWCSGKRCKLPKPSQGVPVVAATSSGTAALEEAAETPDSPATEADIKALGPVTDTVRVYRRFSVPHAWALHAGHAAEAKSGLDEVLDTVLAEWQPGPSLEQGMWHAQAGLDAAGRGGDALMAMRCHLLLAEGYLALRGRAKVEKGAEDLSETHMGAMATAHWCESLSLFRALFVAGGSVPLVRRRDVLWQDAVSETADRLLQCLCQFRAVFVNDHIGLFSTQSSIAQDVQRSARSTWLPPPVGLTSLSELAMSRAPLGSIPDSLAAAFKAKLPAATHSLPSADTTAWQGAAIIPTPLLGTATAAQRRAAKEEQKEGSVVMLRTTALDRTFLHPPSAAEARVLAARCLRGPLHDPGQAFDGPPLTASLDNRPGLAIPPLDLPDPSAPALVASSIGAYISDAKLRMCGEADVLAAAAPLLPPALVPGFRSRTGTLRSHWSNPDAVGVARETGSAAGRSVASGHSSTTTPDPPGRRASAARQGGSPALPPRAGSRAGHAGLRGQGGAVLTQTSYAVSGDSDNGHASESVLEDLLEGHAYLRRLTARSMRRGQHTQLPAEATAAQKLKARRAKYSTFPPQGKSGIRGIPRSTMRRGAHDMSRPPLSGTSGSEGGDGDASSQSESTLGDAATTNMDARGWCVFDGIALLELVRDGPSMLTQCATAATTSSLGAFASGEVQWSPATRVRPLASTSMRVAAQAIAVDGSSTVTMAFAAQQEAGGQMRRHGSIPTHEHGSPYLHPSAPPTLTLPHPNGPLDSAEYEWSPPPLELARVSSGCVSAWLSAAVLPGWRGATRRAALVGAIRTAYGPRAAGLDRAPFSWLMAAAQAHDTRSLQEADLRDTWRPGLPSVAAMLQRSFFCSLLPARGTYVVHAPFLGRMPQLQRYGNAAKAQRNSMDKVDVPLWAIAEVPPAAHGSMASPQPSKLTSPRAGVLSRMSVPVERPGKEANETKRLLTPLHTYARDLLKLWVGQSTTRSSSDRSEDSTLLGSKQLDAMCKALLWAVFASPHAQLKLLACQLQEQGQLAGRLPQAHSPTTPVRKSWGRSVKQKRTAIPAPPFTLVVNAHATPLPWEAMLSVGLAKLAGSNRDSMVVNSSVTGTPQIGTAAHLRQMREQQDASAAESAKLNAQVGTLYFSRTSSLVSSLHSAALGREKHLRVTEATAGSKARLFLPLFLGSNGKSLSSASAASQRTLDTIRKRAAQCRAEEAWYRPCTAVPTCPPPLDVCKVVPAVRATLRASASQRVFPGSLRLLQHSAGSFVDKQRFAAAEDLGPPMTGTMIAEQMDSPAGKGKLPHWRWDPAFASSAAWTGPLNSPLALKTSFFSSAHSKAGKATLVDSTLMRLSPWSMQQWLAGRCAEEDFPVIILQHADVLEQSETVLWLQHALPHVPIVALPSFEAHYTAALDKLQHVVHNAYRRPTDSPHLSTHTRVLQHAVDCIAAELKLQCLLLNLPCASEPSAASFSGASGQ